LVANLLPDRSFAQIEETFIKAGTARAKTTLVTLLRQWFSERFADGLCHAAGIPPSTPNGQVTREQRRSLLHHLTALPLPVVRDRGYLFAEVTAGGVPLAEIDINTMASRLCPGLFFCGEILDVDGRIGGYNFQWAWNTGRLAGLHAARSLSTKT
jgi:predicted Rossmann fold flavoprotein